jgi:hypothetical protein
MEYRLAPIITLLAAISFWTATATHHGDPVQHAERATAVVIPEPLQVLLYGGDRFLAANIETVRATAAATETEAQGFRLLAHTAASRLNPCHADNYWIGNASLSWGGSINQGFELLRNATQCRYWDEWPPFFYGFNQNFFLDNMQEAQHALKIAAQRSPANAPTFNTFSAMLAVGKINDTSMAIKMIKEERDSAKDAKLRNMLDMRKIRLEGLLTLRNAQTTYEKRYGKPLENPQELRITGILHDVPEDPLNIGYEFHSNGFHLKQMKIEQ